MSAKNGKVTGKATVASILTPVGGGFTYKLSPQEREQQAREVSARRRELVFAFGEPDIAETREIDPEIAKTFNG